MMLMSLVRVVLIGLLTGLMSGLVPLTVALAQTLPTLPTPWDTAMPTIDGTTYPATCATLQAQINTAAAASASLNHQVTLELGTTCVGPFVFPARPGPGWVVITGPNGGVVPEGTRQLLANASQLPQVKYGESAQHTGSFSTATNGTHFRIVGIDMTEDPVCSGCAIGTTNYASVYSGYGNGGFTGTGYIIVDRSIIRDSTTSHNKVRGFHADAEYGHTAMIDSYCAGIHDVENDTQCFLSVNNPGPIVVRNNFLQATGENLMIGGGQPGLPWTDSGINLTTNTISFVGNAAIFPDQGPIQVGMCVTCTLPAPLVKGTIYYIKSPSTTTGTTTFKLSATAGGSDIDLTNLGLDSGGSACSGSCTFSATLRELHPRDISITLNLLSKDLTWTSTDWHQIKSLLEIKLGKRVNIDANTFENQDWNGGGQMWRQTVRNESGYFNYAEASDISFTNNYTKNSCGGISSFGSDDGGGAGISKVSYRWNISNNLWQLGLLCSGISSATFLAISIGGGSVDGTGTNCTERDDTCKLHDLTVRHNTIDLGAAGTSIMCVMSQGQKNMDWKDNLIDAAGGAGVLDCNGAMTGSRGTTILNLAWGTSGYTWNYNGIADISVGGEGSSIYPQAQNIYWASGSSILFTNQAAGDYTLQSGSPAKNAASDGTDMGVNFTTYNAARAGGSGGVSTPSPRFSPAINLRRADLPRNLYLTGARP